LVYDGTRCPRLDGSPDLPAMPPAGRGSIARYSMNLFIRLFRSSLGKKYVMAVSGGGLFLFVVGHMLGNLQIYLGPEAINAYGHFLQSTPEILWPARIGLLTLVGLHIYCAITLTAENREARPVPYASPKYPAASFASRTMIVSGLVLLFFIVYHLLHFTVMAKSINLTHQDFGALEDSKHRHDIYRMLIIGFGNPAVSFFYVFSMALLYLHLSHGVSSMFQSLGWKKNSYADLVHKFAQTISLLIFLGNCSIPVCILLGILPDKSI
jgi:succinate dehydrogenase / fumarate reductase cytochrome b subunit